MSTEQITIILVLLSPVWASIFFVAALLFMEAVDKVLGLIK